jgi:hypothetical protein
VAADVGEEELQAVAGAAGNVGLVRDRLDDLLVGGGEGLAHLDAEPLELVPDLLQLDVGELVLERERLELRGLQETAFLSAVYEQPDVLGLEHLLRLIPTHSPLRSVCLWPGLKLSHSRVRLLALLVASPGRVAPKRLNGCPRTAIPR